MTRNGFGSRFVRGDSHRSVSALGNSPGGNSLGNGPAAGSATGHGSCDVRGRNGGGIESQLSRIEGHGQR